VKRNMKVKVKYKKLKEGAIKPTRATDGSIGYDVHAIIEDNPFGVIIKPHEKELIGLGFALEIPEGIGGFLFARSGLANKRGLRPSNCVGVIDNDYRGEVMVSLRNDTDQPMVVENGERIAQLVFLPYVLTDFDDDEVGETDRGTGGFGSTGA